MKQILNFINQPIRRKILFVEAIYRLLHAWIIVRKTGFTRHAHLLGKKHSGDHVGVASTEMSKIADVRWAVNRANRFMGNRFTCLMIALAGKTTLRRLNIPNTLVLGATTKGGDENDMLAHAWLRVGPMVLFGQEEMETYTPILSYVDE